jgi:pimeloyl-ACP methyl ester carboxylesterase
MARDIRQLRGLTLAVVLASLAFATAATAATPLKVSWMTGASAPGTPAKYDKVGVIKVGARSARNVLVLEPGTSAGAAYFVPLAKWIVSRAPGWQVWSVERRENLLEDQSVLNEAKQGKANATTLFDYYLGWIKDSSITPHFQLVPNASVAFAKKWGMSVAVNDLHTVIAAAHKLGGNVVLGGHSLGGSVVTAYATWDFGGKAGANALAGLIYIDGGSFGTESAGAARAALTTLDASSASPWLAFGGITAPFAGLYNATGSEAALIDPNGASLGQASGLLNSAGLTPSVPVTNLGQYGFALNVKTSPPALIAAQAHLGTGLVTTGQPPYGWNGAGALTPITRFATMFSGAGVNDADGTEWYFPARLTLDTAAINNGVANPAQTVLGEKATMGRKLPKSLRIYAFGAALTGPKKLLIKATRALAAQSHIPARNLTLVNEPSYAHNDPAGAYPHNIFFNHLIPFLGTVAAH